MKNLTALLAVLLLSTTAQAGTDEQCLEVHMITGKIMTARQNGVTMPKVIEIFNNIPEFRPVIMMAYEVSQMSAPVNKKIAADEFANKFYLACLQEG